MKDFKQYKLSDLYSIDSGISISKDQSGFGYPFLSFKTVFNNYFLPPILQDYMNTTETQQKKYSIKQGDIFLTRTSETNDELAMSSVALKDYPTATYSGFLKRLRPKNNGVVYEKYIAFYLRNNFFRKVINNYTSLTLRASFNEELFSYLSVYLPSYQTQKIIGDLLFLFESKISTNNSIISKLEEMAKTIYEYWFLQFDFPNHEGKPYASSGGAMKYNEELGREIPSDWEVLNLWERFEFEKGIEIGAKQYLSESGKNRVLFWRVGNMNGTCSTYADEKLFGELLLQPRDICVSFDGSVGKVDFGLVGGYSSGIRNIYDRAKKIDSSVIYQIFKSDFIQQLIHKYATGSNILHASGSITNMRIPYNEKVFEEYQKIIKPMFDKMVQAKQENQKLAQLRDWLLPMLMNGQVRVE